MVLNVMAKQLVLVVGCSGQKFQLKMTYGLIRAGEEITSAISIDTNGNDKSPNLLVTSSCS